MKQDYSGSTKIEGSQKNKGKRWKMKKVALIKGGMGAEREVSLLSAQAVAQAFKDLNIPHQIVECDQNIVPRLKHLKPDRAFLAVHGQYAEDGTLQGLLEYLKIPYTGSGVLASSLCMDKIFFKNSISKHKIPTPHYQTLSFEKTSTSKEVEWGSLKIFLPLPFVVKPARGGSTLGIRICKKIKEILPAFENALKYDHKILLESYIKKGQELAFSYLNGQVLTPVEVVAEGGFYDYKSKYQSQKTKYILPPYIDKKVIEKGRKIALKVFQLCQVRTYGRADFMVRNNKELLITEINTLPGLTKKSLLPKSAEYDGISFNSLIEQILQKATLDYPQRR